MDTIIEIAKAIPVWFYVVFVGATFGVGWLSDWYDERQGLKRP